MNLTVELVNGILQYLGNRPYVETAGLIAEIQKQASAVVKDVVETPKDPE
jgi:hypothetical protein